MFKHYQINSLPESKDPDLIEVGCFYVYYLSTSLL